MAIDAVCVCHGIVDADAAKKSRAVKHGLWMGPAGSDQRDSISRRLRRDLWGAIRRAWRPTRSSYFTSQYDCVCSACWPIAFNWSFAESRHRCRSLPWSSRREGPKKLTVTKSTGDPQLKFGNGVLNAVGVDMATLAKFLSEGQAGRPVAGYDRFEGQVRFPFGVGAGHEPEFFAGRRVRTSSRRVQAEFRSSRHYSNSSG